MIPRLKEIAGNCVALGSVILIGPGLWAFRNGSSWPVSRRTARSLPVTMPATLLVAAAAARAGLPRARHRVAEVEALDRVGEVAHEVAPAQLAVGEDAEAELGLLGEHAQDVPVLELPQPLGSARGGKARFQEVGGPQEAAHLIGPQGCRHGGSIIGHLDSDATLSEPFARCPKRG